MCLCEHVDSSGRAFGTCLRSMRPQHALSGGACLCGACLCGTCLRSTVGRTRRTYQRGRPADDGAARSRRSSPPLGATHPVRRTPPSERADAPLTLRLDKPVLVIWTVWMWTCLPRSNLFGGRLCRVGQSCLFRLVQRCSYQRQIFWGDNESVCTLTPPRNVETDCRDRHKNGRTRVPVLVN